MDKQGITALLQQVANGETSVEDAVLKLKMQPIQEVDEYAKVDMHRGLHQGVPEVIYGAGKTKEHILGIARTMLASGQETVLVTRIDGDIAAFLEGELQGTPALIMSTELKLMVLFSALVNSETFVPSPKTSSICSAETSNGIQSVFQ